MRPSIALVFLSFAMLIFLSSDALARGFVHFCTRTPVEGRPGCIAHTAYNQGPFLAREQAILVKRSLQKTHNREHIRYIASIARIARLGVETGDLRGADKGSAYALAAAVQSAAVNKQRSQDEDLLYAYVWLTRAYVLFTLGNPSDAAKLYQTALTDKAFQKSVRARFKELAIGVRGAQQRHHSFRVFELFDLFEAHAQPILELAPSHKSLGASLRTLSDAFFSAMASASSSFAQSGNQKIDTFDKFRKSLDLFGTRFSAGSVDDQYRTIYPLLARSVLAKEPSRGNPIRSRFFAQMLLMGAERLYAIGDCTHATEVFRGALLVASLKEGDQGRIAMKARVGHAICLVELGKIRNAHKKLQSILADFRSQLTRLAFQETFVRRSLADREIIEKAAFTAINSAWRLWKETGDNRYASDAFAALQLMNQSAAGHATSLASLRQRSTDTQLRQFMRKVQANSERFVHAERYFIHYLKNPERYAGRLRRISAFLKTTAHEMSSQREELARRFPSTHLLVPGSELPMEKIQSELDSNDAFIAFAVPPNSLPRQQTGFRFILTSTGFDWQPISVNGNQLRHDVETLRCGLDASKATLSECFTLTGRVFTQADADGGKLPAFDANLAFRLYKTLFRKSLIGKGYRHLIVHTQKDLDRLPLSVLVRSRPGINKASAIDWIIRDHAISRVTSLAELVAKQRGDASRAGRQPYFGVGNPLLKGGPHHKDAALAATRATKCDRYVASLGQSRRVRVGVAPTQDAEAVRGQAPLPETAFEICEVGKALGASSDAIILAANSTEERLKRLSLNGHLLNFRVIHFATHGAMAGEISADAEPGLILTPPLKASSTDDGYLSSSEIAQMKLNADIVILSACNTGAAQGKGTSLEALSGLARAFFFAGARSTLVSHWYVDSNATVRLITNAAREAIAAKRTDWAKGLRKAMLQMIGSGGRHAHPSQWAPFFLVGQRFR